MQERNTVQRQLVYRAVQDLACHPTAEEVYGKVVSTHPSISKGTVYRNLNRLAETGMLRKIQMCIRDSLQDCCSRIRRPWLCNFHQRGTSCH